MKLLFWNIGYARNLDGSFRGYVKNGSEIFYHSEKRQRTQLDNIIEVVKSIAPDIFLSAEVSNGSFRNNHFNQHAYAAEQLGCVTDVSTSKYKSHFLRIAPFHAGNMNSVCVFSPATVENIHLSSGGKTLVQKVSYQDWIIFTVHLSLIYSIRTRQLGELASAVQLCPDTKNIVVCGDFNTLRGKAELDFLCRDARLDTPAKVDATFPAYKPKLHLDHVLYRLIEPKEVTVTVLPSTLSDHRSLLCEFN